jgi:tRNA (guanosine-2'-O-)-methyltransferase
MKQLIDYLSQFVTERRFNLLRKVAAERTRYITIALEDIYQSHNASAVLRTCDCLGIQDVHIIENKNRYNLNPDVELGSAQWLSLHKYSGENNPALTAITHLKSQGYRIVATSPHTNDVSLDDFDLSEGPVAILFGTEMRGLTNETLAAADEYLRIPMSGFTESFNISVSAAIVLYTLTHQLRISGLNWQLPDFEIDTIILDWLRKTIHDSDLLEKRYIFNQQNQGACPSSP